MYIKLLHADETTEQLGVNGLILGLKGTWYAKYGSLIGLPFIMGIIFIFMIIVVVRYVVSQEPNKKQLFKSLGWLIAGLIFCAVLLTVLQTVVFNEIAKQLLNGSNFINHNNDGNYTIDTQKVKDEDVENINYYLGKLGLAKANT